MFFYLIPALGAMAAGPLPLLEKWRRLRRDSQPHPEYLRIGQLTIICLLTIYLVWSLGARIGLG